MRYRPNRYAETSQTTSMNNTYNIHIGDNQLILPTLPDNSIDSIVTDPPYELGFMGKTWDATGIAYNVQMWRECLRVLKPGGHLLAFSGSRTYHRMAVAIEDAGFQIRDQIMWVYGSGFPKSLNISKAIDKAAGVEREVIGKIRNNQPGDTSAFAEGGIGSYQRGDTTERDVVGGPATAEAKEWDGWGTALKPAHEPIVLARKPLDGTVANNVLVHGVGGINIDGCRIETQDSFGGGAKGTSGFAAGYEHDGWVAGSSMGRFPANFIHDGSDEVLELFPDTAGSWGVRTQRPNRSPFISGSEELQNTNQRSESGSAARFFYCAKANKKDRNEGLDHLPARRASAMGYDIGLGEAGEGMFKDRNPQKQNFHPTVKPTDLMRYLCRLITPPNGTVLDPFTGSGSTGKAAILEGFNFIGIEQSEEYAAIAKARIEHVTPNE